MFSVSKHLFKAWHKECLTFNPGGDINFLSLYNCYASYVEKKVLLWCTAWNIRMPCKLFMLSPKHFSEELTEYLFSLEPNLFEAEQANSLRVADCLVEVQLKGFLCWTETILFLNTGVRDLCPIHVVPHRKLP